MTEILAHRGAKAERTENTMEAFRRAEETGAFGIELDVHVLKDKTCVVYHDGTVHISMIKKKSIYDFDRDSIKDLFVRPRKFSHSRTEKIPFLEEVLDFLQGNSLFLNLEIKRGKDMPCDEPEDFVLSVLERYPFMRDRMIISSFDYTGILCRIKEKCPMFKLGVLYEKENGKKMVKWCLDHGMDAIHPRRVRVTKDLIEFAHQNGLQVNPWTVNRKKDIMRFAGWGADMIITDDPQRAVMYIKSL